MRRVLFVLACLTLATPAAALAQQVVMPPTGRYQLVVVPGHAWSPFLVDTTTGCVWAAVQDQEKKGAAFVEVEVRNLHWNLASQQLLASRIDGVKELNEDQKRGLKQQLEQTRCGSFSVLLGPDQPPAAGAAPPGRTPSGPTKR